MTTTKTSIGVEGPLLRVTETDYFWNEQLTYFSLKKKKTYAFQTFDRFLKAQSLIRFRLSEVTSKYSVEVGYSNFSLFHQKATFVDEQGFFQIFKFEHEII